MARPGININEVLSTLSRIKAALERLRRREAGVVESEGTGFPHSINLRNFRSTDEIAVVTSGWYDDGALHPIFVHTTVEWDGDNHVLTLRPRDVKGEPVAGGAFVHIDWVAMV
jgi:hypothetical protein